MQIEYTGINIHQGDTQWFQINALPDGAIKIKKRFIAKAEYGGGFHALFGDYNMFQWEEYIYRISVIDVRSECVLNHSFLSGIENISIDLNRFQILEKKNHRHIIIPKGIYLVGIQQRFDPMEGFKKQVFD